MELCQALLFGPIRCERYIRYRGLYTESSMPETRANVVLQWWIRFVMQARQLHAIPQHHLTMTLPSHTNSLSNVLQHSLTAGLCVCQLLWWQVLEDKVVSFMLVFVFTLVQFKHNSICSFTDLIPKLHTQPTSLNSKDSL